MSEEKIQALTMSVPGCLGGCGCQLNPLFQSACLAAAYLISAGAGILFRTSYRQPSPSFIDRVTGNSLLTSLIIASAIGIGATTVYYMLGNIGWKSLVASVRTKTTSTAKSATLKLQDSLMIMVKEVRKGDFAVGVLMGLSLSLGQAAYIMAGGGCSTEGSVFGNPVWNIGVLGSFVTLAAGLVCNR